MHLILSAFRAQFFCPIEVSLRERVAGERRGARRKGGAVAADSVFPHQQPKNRTLFFVSPSVALVSMRCHALFHKQVEPIAFSAYEKAFALYTAEKRKEWESEFCLRGLLLRWSLS